jgi:nucleoside-diphosphate-sugar epimerase
MIFLIGANGFVGSAFSRHLAAKGLPHIAITRENHQQFAEQRCEVLINANGNSRKYIAAENPTFDFELSVLSTLRFLQEFRPAYYVHISSVDVYNDVSDPNRNAEDAIINPITLSGYGFSKYVAELAAQRYASKWLILRLGGMLGEGLKKNLVFDLLNHRPLLVHPDSSYQYVDTATVAKTGVDLVLRGKHGEIYNICGQGVVSSRQVARWAGLPDPECPKGTPIERYEVSNRKIMALASMPRSEDVVCAFIQSYSKSRSSSPTGAQS